MIHIKYHMTRHQAIILGSIFSTLAVIFGPNQDIVVGASQGAAHISIAALFPVLVGLLDAFFHHITGVVPKPPVTGATDVATSTTPEPVDIGADLAKAIEVLQALTGTSQATPIAPVVVQPTQGQPDGTL